MHTKEYRKIRCRCQRCGNVDVVSVGYADWGVCSTPYCVNCCDGVDDPQLLEPSPVMYPVMELGREVPKGIA